MISKKGAKKVEILMDIFKGKPLTLFMLIGRTKQQKANFIYLSLGEPNPYHVQQD